jgi:hypothetical protein
MMVLPQCAYGTETLWGYIVRVGEMAIHILAWAFWA